MCGRFQLVAPVDDLIESFEVDVPTFDRWPLRWNVAPSQESPVLLRGRRGERRLGALGWGLVPAWAKSPSTGSRWINARSESVATRPAFRDAFARRRCLVPMTGFYEWRAASDGPKTPFLIRRPGGRPFAVAGIWERWRGGSEGADGEPETLATFAILTTAASRWMSALHPRMPVLLEAEAAGRWLDPRASPTGLLELCRPAPDDAFEAFEVSRAVNAPTNDRAEVGEPVPGGERHPQGPSGPADTR